MSEKTARALGAGSGVTVTVEGKEYSVRPLGLRELTEVERDCLQRFKRQYLETYSTNLDLLPEADRAGLMGSKLDEVGKWDMEDLPPRFVHDPDNIRLTKSLKKWVHSNMGDGGIDDDSQLKRIASVALDQETLSGKEYTTLTGSQPPRLKVPYINWWITSCFEGMVTFIWACFQKDGLTREQILSELGHDINALVTLSREIERISAPKAGNG